jgi:hypothetical protein
MKAADAAIEAARLRLRPILMTSFAFIFGVIPLIVATGAGAEMRQALGTVVFFGMIGVTFFGVFLTPVFYTTIRRLSDHRLVPAERPVRSLPAYAAGGEGQTCGSSFDWVKAVMARPVFGLSRPGYLEPSAGRDPLRAKASGLPAWAYSRLWQS